MSSILEARLLDGSCISFRCFSRRWYHIKLGSRKHVDITGLSKYILLFSTTLKKERKEIIEKHGLTLNIVWFENVNVTRTLKYIN
jgi:hypothetical protein